MRKSLLLVKMFLIGFIGLKAQTNPAITSWLQNTTTTGYYYMSGNSTPISHGILVNCQQVRYSANNVYVDATGMPAYLIGPYLDGNPNQAGNQNAIFKFPLNPTENTGTKTPTTGGNIGVFVNGVAMFDFRDGVAWNTTTNALCGGPGNPPCPGGPGTTQSWMRDAVLFEKPGFDCSKGHPAGTNYHHHQNPSAFDLDLNVVSTICNLYDADGLYTINPSQHSPLIGYAYDGFPVYGAYGYANADGTGGITRIKSGYQLRNITVRTHHADGTDVPDGPPVNTTYPIGTFREDYEWVSHPGDESYLDVHNGRFCVTPEYPNGTYAYFATVDANHNSAYPYLVGPTYYGVKSGGTVTSVLETTTVYTGLFLTATPDTIVLNSALGSNQSVSVSSNTSWQASLDQSWVSLNINSGNNNGSINVIAQENTGIERFANLTLTASGVTSKIVVIKQLAQNALFLDLDKTTINVGNTSSIESFNIISNTSWQISCDSSWIIINPTNGSNNSTIQTNILENTSSTSRTATVKVTGTSVGIKEILITQAGNITSSISNSIFFDNIKIFPNPTSDIIAIQISGINNQDLKIEMYDMQGKLIKATKLNKGQTISYIDIQTLYSGAYVMKLSNNEDSFTRKIIVEK